MAARLIARTGRAERFASSGAYANYCGAAPVQIASADKTRHRLSRCGDRQLNSALYTTAVIQIRMPDSPGHAYYQRKLAEGKSPKEAKRCLKRRLADHMWRVMIADERRHARAADPGGHTGATLISCVASPTPTADPSDKSRPGPATSQRQRPVGQPCVHRAGRACRAIEIAWPAVTTTASGTGVPLDPRGYVAAARRLLTRPGSLADQEIRERAIGLLEPSLHLLPPGDHQRLEGQLMLATALIFGCECTGDAASLQRAEHLLTSWGEQFTPGGFGRARYLAIVAWARLRQAEADGAEHLVAQAVRDARKGAREHPGDAELSAALGRALMLRYERTADRRALDQAVRPHTSATERTGDGDPLRAGRLTALGSAIATKALLTGESAGIERAVNIQRQAAAAADPQDPGTAMVLHNLGTTLLHYYELSGQPVVLEQALELHRRALQVTPPAHSHYPVCAEGLGNALLFSGRVFLIVCHVPLVEYETDFYLTNANPQLESQP